MSAPTTNPGHPTHPPRATGGDPSAWLTAFCARSPGAVPARVEMEWPIENDLVGTVELRAEGRRRLSALGDRYGFTSVHEWWDVDGSTLSVVALVAWYPAGAVSGRVELLEPVAA